MYLINISLTFLLINRWFVSGHFPLSNLYESLIFLSWSFSTIYSITSFTLRGEAKATLLPIISWSVAPITLLTCGYAFFCVPPELQKAESLVPALQSNWLIMHVSVMILSYASLILGSLFAFSLLLIMHFEQPFHALLPILRKQELPSKMVRIPFLQVLRWSVTPKVFQGDPTTYVPAKEISNGISLSTKQVNNFFSYKQEESLASFVPTEDKLMNVKQQANTNNKQTLIKNNNFLDNLSYRFIGLGFALLTLGIISGAVWANSAWGSYWSWDPKETWAFITWLTYAIYLHLRISKGWYGKQSALVALFGFFVVWFCYLGVNLFGKGLHSYAFV